MRSQAKRQTDRVPISPGERTFTLAQANRALVLVRRIVEDIVADYARVLEYQEILELEQRYGAAGTLARVQADMAACADRIQSCLVELNDIGVVLRDCSTGLVDFPAHVAGRSVHFAWQIGDERIEHWREAGDDSGSWRPITALAEVLSVGRTS